MFEPYGTHTLNFILQVGSTCSMKNEGLKRGLQSIDSSDYQMGENMTGVISPLYNLDKDPIFNWRLEHYGLHSKTTKDELFV